MTPEEQIQRQLDQDAAIAKLGHKAMKPHPHGLPGRLRDAIADGDEQLAKALTDALLAERE
jgi:hypothetical protein